MSSIDRIAKLGETLLQQKLLVCLECTLDVTFCDDQSRNHYDSARQQYEEEVKAKDTNYEVRARHSLEGLPPDGCLALLNSPAWASISNLRKGILALRIASTLVMCGWAFNAFWDRFCTFRINMPMTKEVCLVPPADHQLTN